MPDGTPPDRFSGCIAAGPDDADDIYDFLLPMHAENAIFPLSETKAREAIHKCTHDKLGIAGIIRGRSGAIEGSIGIVVTSQWYTDAVHLQEIWNYVSPQHRNTKHARTLLEFGQWASDRMTYNAVQRGVTDAFIPFIFSLITRKRLIAKMRLFQRSAPQVGAIFMWPIAPVDCFSQRVGADFDGIKDRPDAPFINEVYTTAKVAERV